MPITLNDRQDFSIIYNATNKNKNEKGLFIMANYNSKYYKYVGEWKVLPLEVQDHNYIIQARYLRTRNGFVHRCEIYVDGLNNLEASGKCNYINRTWEKFDYETVINNTIDKLKADKEVKAELKRLVYNYRHELL